jgi:phosphoserine phosphatase
MTNKKPKLVFFDMEGTLFKNIYARAVRDGKGNTAANAWQAIAESLGQKALNEEDETKRKWNAGDYSGYVEWMEDTIRIHQKYGLKKETYDKIFSKVEYHEGVIETFKKLNKEQIKTTLISGGFKSQANRALMDLKINHAFVACEYLWDKKGNLVHWNLLPADYEGKVDFMKLIMKEHGLKPEDCAFVGDGKNDIHLAKAVGTSIAFNGARELEEVSTYKIRQPEGEEDFTEILQYLGISK